MSDRKNLISDFEYAVRKADAEGWDFVDLTTEDGFEILDMLKAQEPRVLTLEEVMQYVGYSEKIPPRGWAKLPLWTESRDGTGVISGYRDVENLRNLINMSGLDGNYIAYNHWRCWSSYPTLEQRKEDVSKI